mgnify:CR=1 FL=1
MYDPRMGEGPDELSVAKIEHDHVPYFRATNNNHDRIKSVGMSRYTTLDKAKKGLDLVTRPLVL